MPASLVTTERPTPVPTFLAVTVTPGSTLPVWSVVDPVIVPVVSCAAATPHIAATNSIITNGLRISTLNSDRTLNQNPELEPGTRTLNPERGTLNASLGPVFELSRGVLTSGARPSRRA